MWTDTEASKDIDIEDHGNSYLCRHCNHEGLKATFGMRIECPSCGSDNIVTAKLWRRFKSLHEDGEWR
jgi:DNA-directed RNA polymerase subunit RPC12/RpoP